MAQGEAIQGQRVGVVIFGFGTVGQATLELCLQRPFIDVRGVISRSPAKAGQPAGEFVATAPRDLLISAEAEQTLDATRPDVVLHATQSLAREVLPQIHLCVDAGANVISTSEELAFLAAQHEDLAVEAGTLARQRGVVIAAAGVNPGFVFDVLPLTLAGVSWDVPRIAVRRVLDASVFGRDVQRHLGLGYTREEFDRDVRSGEIRGHIGFPESAAMLCRKMGRTLDRVEQVLDPIMATHDYELRDWRISSGTSVGVIHHAVGWVDGQPWLDFEVVLHPDPAEMGWTVQDTISIPGRHTISLTLDPGCHAVLTTAARLVNTIPQVLQAPPGLYAAVDLPPSGPWLAPRLPMGTQG